MITLEDVIKNDEVRAFIEGAQKHASPKSSFYII